MGVDIGIKKQTKELKETYLTIEKAFDSRSEYIEDETHPFYEIYKKYDDIIESHPWIEEKTDNKIFDMYNGARWFNLGIVTPDYIPHSNNKEILNFSVSQKILFTEELKNISDNFDKIYLTLYPDDIYVKNFSEFFHYLVDNNLMLIPN